MLGCSLHPAVKRYDNEKGVSNVFHALLGRNLVSGVLTLERETSKNEKS